LSMGQKSRLKSSALIANRIPFTTKKDACRAVDVGGVAADETVT
jgi:hypothetical protein